MSCLHAHGISDLPMGNGPGLQQALHPSNGVVERKIGQLNEYVRSTLLASDLPAYLWPEVYMAMCHTHNLVPNSALQRDLKKKQKEVEEDMKQEQERTDATTLIHNAGENKRGEPGGRRPRQHSSPQTKYRFGT